MHAALEADCDPDALFALVDDLAVYPRWTDLVHRAERQPGLDPAWQVEIRAALGPLARSKRLRMVRTRRDPVQREVVFERQEVDGRRHSPWVLQAAVAPSSELRVHLHYGGRLWTGGVLERALAESIVSGRQRLLELVSPTP